MTIRLGLVGRADDGGLGTMTQELARHLCPAATLIVQLHEPRGTSRPERFDVGHDTEIRGNTPGAVIDDESLRWLLERSDVIYMAEYPYRDDMWQRCNAAGVPVVLHAMPELYDAKQWDRPNVVCVPTDWSMDRMPPDTLVIPVPVAQDRFSFRQRTEVTTFGHFCAPAMLDRNGTRTVVNALPFVEQECRLILFGTDQIRLPRHTNVRVEFRPEPRRDYWECYDEIDVLLMPRRYAGLCLPVQEAAAAGVPSVMTDVSPNDFYTGLRIPVRPDHATTAQMKGGWFNVYDGDPQELGLLMDMLVLKPEVVAEASLRAGMFAVQHSWGRLEPVYRQLLERAAALGVRR